MEESILKAAAHFVRAKPIPVIGNTLAGIVGDHPAGGIYNVFMADEDGSSVVSWGRGCDGEDLVRA